MEVSVIGCIPHVQHEKSEPYENSHLILVGTEPVVDTIKYSDKQNLINQQNISSSNEKDIKAVQNEEFLQSPSKNVNDSLILVQNKEPSKAKMRVEAEEVVDPSSLAFEVASHVNGSICPENGECSSELPFQSIDSCSIPDASASVSNVTSSSNTSCMDDSSTSLNLSNPNSPQKKKRYLFLFKPSLGKILVKTKNGDSFKCYTCGGIYRQKFSLKRHFLRTHIDYRYISEADVANCKIPVPNYVSQHSNLENANTPNGRKKFKKSSDDVFLENNDTGFLPGLYRCHDCTNVSFDTDSELREHYNRHPDSIKKKYECPICQASFIKKQILSRHIAGHEGKKIKILCKKCNLEFSSKAELESHMPSHSSGKTCRVCEKVLSNVANRKRHERLHLNSGKRCPHCDQCFAQRKELDRHVKSQHGDLSRECTVCNQICPSPDSLALHMRQKHRSSPKLPENASASESRPKTNPKAKACLVCKKVFHSIYAMLKHKRNAHPFHSRRKRHRKTAKQKNAISRKVPENNNEYKRSYVRPGRPPGSKNKTSQSDKSVVSFLTKSERIIFRRTRKEEAEFYNKIHENIAYNLTNCIEGRACQLSLKQYNFSDLHHPSDRFQERVHFPWEFYNFPSWYDVDNALKTKGREIKRPENASIADDFLQNVAGLTPTNLSPNKQPKCTPSTKNENVSPAENSRAKNPCLEEKKKLIGKEIVSVLICQVCKEKIESLKKFAEHCINNHPNVECSYVEIVGDKDSPPVIPPEMCRIDISPVGFRFACDVPPLISEDPVTCTKCRKQFRKGSELHDHIAICGNLMNLIRRSCFKVPSSPKISMRKRMTLAQFRAGFNNRSGRTPEKRPYYISKTSRLIGDKTTKPEKMLFYKNGRLQTKSLTADKNYFNTKPMKPVKSGSKRGRKSYEEKSLAYRHASMQPSTSRECPHCRVVFASIQSLNNHMKNPCHQQLLEKPKRCLKFSKALFKNASDKSSSKNTSIEANHSELSRKYTKLAVSHIRSPSTMQSEVASVQNLQTCQNGSDGKISNSSVVIDIPIDLSRSSNDNSEAASSSPSSSQTSSAHIMKSAVEIAMEAVHKHIVDSPNVNTPILKLQQITDTLTADKVTGKSLTSTSVPKSGSGKKPGRPRKLKKEAATTVFMPPVSCNVIEKKTQVLSKPKKLEEIVKGIKESKVRCEEKRLQKTVCFGQISTAENATVLPTNSLLSNVPSVNQDQTSVCQSPKSTNDKEICKRDLTDSFSAKSSSRNFSSSSNDCDKSVIVDNSTAISTIQETDKLPVTVAVLSVPESPLKDKLDVVCNVTPTVNSEIINFADIQNDTLKRAANLDMNVSSASEKTIAETSDADTHDVNSHGRNSPTSEFECLLKSINQRLQSEEKNQHDDSAIPWLEDEKFEIPPSRSKLNVSVIPSSSAELPQTDTGSCVISPSININKDKQTDMDKSRDEQVVEKRKESTQEQTTINTDETNKIPLITNNISPDMESASAPVSKNESPKMQPVTTALENVDGRKTVEADRINKSPSPNEKLSSDPPSASAVILNKNKKSAVKSTIGKLFSPRNKPGTSKNKPPAVKSKVNLPDRKRPGRPRKKLPNLQVEPSNKKSKSLPLSPNTKSSIENTASITSVQIDASLKRSITQENSIAHVSNNIMSERLSLSLAEAIPVDSEKSGLQELSSSAELEKLVSEKKNNSAASKTTLKNIRTKAKGTEDNENNNLKALFKSATTEFGKNLASKVKEKMRLSLEQDLAKTVTTTEDASNSTYTSETSDANSKISNEELLKVVKKEFEPIEQKIHSCPYCMLEFAYLTNFRRHIKQCKARVQTNETELVSGLPSNLLHLPKKDEVDYSMLNLYRFQSRQTDMLKEDENASKLIKTYTCSICHKIYLNLFNLMQHKLSSHKLCEQSNPGCSEDMNILSFASGLAPDSLQHRNEGDGHENINFSSLNNDPILEDYKKPSDGPCLGESVGDNKEVCTKPKDGHNIDSTVQKIDDASPLDVLGNSVSKEVKNDEKKGKRKRGRPFGWRKNLDITRENVQNKKLLKRDGKKTPLLKKKDVKALSKESILTNKLKATTKRIIIEGIKKIVAEKKSKLISPEKQKSVVESQQNSLVEQKSPIPFKDTGDKKVVIDSSVNAISAYGEVAKTVPKRSPVKTTAYSESILSSVKDVSENKTAKSPVKILEKTAMKTVSSVNASPKRSRGKLSVSPATTPNEPPSKSETLPRRRPGRPPRTSFSPSCSKQTSKISILSVNGARNSKRTGPVLSNIDSSDSDEEDVKPNNIPVKRNLKCCILCSAKFVTSLELKRHIELKHNRQKSELKRSDLKSSSFNTSEGGKDMSEKLCSSPQKKSLITAKSDYLPLKKLELTKSDLLLFSKKSDVAKSDQLPFSKKSDVTKSDQLPLFKKNVLTKLNLFSANKKSDLSKLYQLPVNRKSDFTKSDQLSLSKKSDSSKLPQLPLSRKSDFTKSDQLPLSRKSDLTKSNLLMSEMKKSKVVLPKTVQLNTSILASKSPVTDTAKGDSVVSLKRNDSPQKHFKKCAICKQKFVNGALLLKHLQLFHNRKSEPIAIKPNLLVHRRSQSIIKSSQLPATPTKKKELSSDRSSLSRQCRKPLPPLKRPRIKKEPIEQVLKKPKI